MVAIKSIDTLTDYYKTRNEGDRLLSKSGAVEFIVTTAYINKYLKRGDHILEVGCGTGQYTLFYARKGYTVDAVELVESNLEILQKNRRKGDRISAIQGNALDLSMYADNLFDITLLLGPMYHLYTEDDKLQCLKESIRVTKKDGIIFVAFCQFDAPMIQTGFLHNKINFLVENGMLDEETYLPISNPAGIFELYRKEQIDLLNEHFSVQRLHYIGTDMFTQYFPEQIESMDDRMYQRYLDYTFTVCENPNLVGLSNHTLDVLKKVSDR